MIEAVPARALGSLAEAVEERLAAIRVEHVVLAGNEEDRQPGFSQNLLRIVELVVARELRDIAGMNDEIRLVRQRLHLRDRFAEGRPGVGVGGFVEPKVAVAQLHEGEWLDGRAPDWACHGRVEPDRTRDPAIEREQRACSGPGHALQEVAAVFFNFVEHRSSSLRWIDAMTGRTRRLFPAG